MENVEEIVDLRGEGREGEKGGGGEEGFDAVLCCLPDV